MKLKEQKKFGILWLSICVPNSLAMALSLIHI